VPFLTQISPNQETTMARLFWLTVMAAFGAALLAGASWAAAYTAVGTLLGSPPPEMGIQSTTFLWEGMPQVPDHPRVWRFTFGPTRIPGALTVRIYVSPFGRVVATEPPDLEARVQTLHPL
jgi:hypothetical protein